MSGGGRRRAVRLTVSWLQVADNNKGKGTICRVFLFTLRVGVLGIQSVGQPVPGIVSGGSRHRRAEGAVLGQRAACRVETSRQLAVSVPVACCMSIEWHWRLDQYSTHRTLSCCLPCCDPRIAIKLIGCIIDCSPPPSPQPPRPSSERSVGRAGRLLDI